jgi:hypothetical protein
VSWPAGRDRAGQHAASAYVGQHSPGRRSDGFNNMSRGDAPIFKFIADNYAISDNYHQALMGHTSGKLIESRPPIPGQRRDRTPIRSIKLSARLLFANGRSGYPYNQ